MRGSTGTRVPDLAVWSLAALAFMCVRDVEAQSPRRTTVGRLLGEPVDTIEVSDRRGGELGSTEASLQLVRNDAGYTGTLRIQMWRNDFGAPERRCDTVMTASMTTSAAKRLFALLRPTVIELGEASTRLPVTDVHWDASDRFTSGRDAVVIQSGTMLLHGESRYRTPLKRDRNGRILPPSQFIDGDTRLMKVHDMLRPYLQLDRLSELSRACSP